MVRSLPLLALFACTGVGSDSDSAADSAANNGHPLAPDAYEDGWDIESAGCDGATVYWAFEGVVNDDDQIVGDETWYWFFSEEGWDSDCADVFEVSADSAKNPITDDACNTCDRDFKGTMALDEGRQGCTQFEGYESILYGGENDKDAEQTYNLVLMLDTDPLGGEGGETQVWSYLQPHQSSQWIDRTIGLGNFTPEKSGEVDGPGDLTWVRSDGMCVEITEG